MNTSSENGKRLDPVTFEVLRSDDQAIRTVKIFRPLALTKRAQR